jgi:AcrR family transcriptional regulator
MADDDLVSAAAPSDGAAVSWREVAVARLVDPARVRAEARVQRILDAALELMGEGRRSSFTLQDIVDRSGVSLRTIYQHFTGKRELLLALFEESLRSAAAHLREHLSDGDDPVERLRFVVLEFHHICRVSDPGRSPGSAPLVMTEYARQLLTSHPKEAVAAFAPLADLIEELLDEAQVAGMVRADLWGRPIAGIVLQSAMCGAFAAAIGGVSPRAERDAAETLWQLVLDGIAARP